MRIYIKFSINKKITVQKNQTYINLEKIPNFKMKQKQKRLTTIAASRSYFFSLKRKSHPSNFNPS